MVTRETIELLSFHELLQRLESGECDQIEAKRAYKSVGKSVLETISAFSNESHLGGGYLLLGIDEKVQETGKTHVVAGVADVEQIQNEVASLCRTSFNIPIRPVIEVHSHPQGNVVSVFIPESMSHDKPVYITSQGRDRGAFRRIGASDQRCTRYDLDQLYRQRSQLRYEEEVLSGTSWEDLDPQAIQLYRSARRQINPDAAELQLDEADLLLALKGATATASSLKPTVAGIVLFGKETALRRLLPLATRVDYILVDGVEWIPDPNHRYHTVEFREALVTLIPRLLNHIVGDIPVSFSLNAQSLRREDVPSIPRAVIREALANALTHRDYSEKQPVQIIRYANRIEFHNPGYSLKPLEELGRSGSKSRNETISVALHDLNFAENKGTGIRTMQRSMKQANLSVPLIESNREGNAFTLSLLSHHLFDERDVKWLAKFNTVNLSDEEARALIVIREMGALTNADYRMINSVDTLTASTSLRKLRDFALLKQNGKGSRTYYVPTQLLLDTLHNADGASKKQLSEGLTPQTMALSEGLTPQTIALSEDCPDLPEDLRHQINRLGQRPPPAQIKVLVKRLCGLRPLSLATLARMLDRNPRYLRDNYLTPMLLSGELMYQYPENPAHPKQAYKAANKCSTIG